jgi:serine phosphatase RsbU (regulator of sigma subunit)
MVGRRCRIRIFRAGQRGSIKPLRRRSAAPAARSQIGQTLVSALEGLRAYTQEHRLALTLQRSLLPARLPTLSEYDVAVRYVPASDYAEIGGDFYELCQLPGRLVVAVGDVAGHSLHAATIMAELRHATRAYLAEGHAPAGVLDRLNQLLLSLIPDEMATLCLLDIEPSTGAVRLANAGHPPPLLVTAGDPNTSRRVRRCSDCRTTTSRSSCCGASD